MSEKIKLFSQMWELDEENKLEFWEFEKLNDFLERNPLFKYVDIYNSYIKIILDEWKTPNFAEYSELDFQVKRLIEEVKVPVNKVLLFAELKYWWINEIIKWFFTKVPHITDEAINEIIKVVNERKTWNIIILLGGINKQFSIPFNLNWKVEDFHKNIKECFAQIDFGQVKEWKILWIWIWVK